MLAYNQNSKGSKKNMFSPLCTWSSFIETALPKRRQSCLCFGNVAETVSRSSEVFERRDRIMCIEYQRIPPEGLFVAELTSSWRKSHLVKYLPLRLPESPVFVPSYCHWVLALICLVGRKGVRFSHLGSLHAILWLLLKWRVEDAESSLYQRLDTLNVTWARFLTPAAPRTVSRLQIHPWTGQRTTH